MQSYREIGELLAAARGERRLSIAEVSAALHIRQRYLLALEAGDLASMPGIAYAKGYLTRYVAYLSLDHMEILRRFDLVAQEAAATHFFMPHSFSHDKRVDPVTAAKFAALAVILLLAWTLWIRSPSGTLPMVDAVPEKVMAPPPARISAETVGRVACLRPQNGLYPPCIWSAPAAEKSMMYAIKP